MSTQNQFPEKWPVFGIVLLSILLPYFFAAFFIQPEGGVIPESARIYIFIGELFIVFPGLLYIYRRPYSIKQVYRLRGVSQNVLAWSAVIGVSISVLGDELDRLISLFLKPPEWLMESMGFFQISSFGEFVVLVSALMIITPIAEELLFRGFLQTSLEYRTQDVTKSVLLTALAFALLHMNTWWILQIYLFGVILSYLSWRTQSVLPGIVTHMGINGLSLLFANLGESATSWYEMGDHVSIFWLALALAGVYFGLQNINNAFPLDTRESETIIHHNDSETTSESKPG